MPRRSFSLASILLLTAVVAIVLAGVRAVSIGKFQAGDWLAAIAYIGSPILGGMLGAGMGASQPRPVLGVLVGLPIGVLVGIAVAVLLVGSVDVWVMGVGSLLVVLFAAVVRALSARGQEP